MNLTDSCCRSQQLVGKLHGNAFHFWAIADVATAVENYVENSLYSLVLSSLVYLFHAVAREMQINLIRGREEETFGTAIALFFSC